jgi:two-component system sensor histidine kinase KdpD
VAPPAARWSWAVGTLAVAAVTALGLVAFEHVSLADLAMLYVVAIMIAALGGRGPSLLAATLSVLTFDFCFVPPRFTLAVSDLGHLVTFAVMFAAGLSVSALTTRLRRQERDALVRERRTAAILGFTREIAAAEAEADIAAVAVRHVEELLGVGAAVLVPETDGDPTTLTAIAGLMPLSAPEQSVAAWSLGHRQPAGHGTATLPGAAVTAVPLDEDTPRGVLVTAGRRDAPAFTADERHVLAALARQTGLALGRVQLAAAARDASVRARTEELRSSLLSAVSHDLRTPLAVITGAATSLRDDGGRLPPPVAAELVTTIVDEARRLERVLQNLLGITRVETGLEPARAWVPVSELCGSALTRLADVLGDRAVELDVPDELQVSVDPVLFEQVLINLIENAVKHGVPPIAISARRHGPLVELAVADAGAGVDPALGPRLFEKFFQAPGARRGGVGPGPGGVPRHRHGPRWHHRGRARDDRRRALRGAAADAAAAAAADARRRARGAAVTPGTKVLIVEDDPQMVRFLRATLSAHELVVAVAEGVAAGATAAAADPPDVVLLDLGLPDGDGLELVRRLRAWTAVPIIVLSARGREDDKVAALDAGADDYLTKPFGVRELFARIRVALRHRPGATTTAVITAGAITIDDDRHEVRVEDRVVKLTPIEYRLLALLVRHAGKVLTHRMLLKEIWGPNAVEHVHYVRVQMAALRAKIEANPSRPRWLLTEPGVGYRLSDASDAGAR